MTMIPTPSPVKSRPLFSKKAPKKPEPFRASQESRSSQDGRLFYVLVFRDHSPTGTQLDYRSRTLFGGHEKVASAAMGSGVPLGRARTDVSSMNAPLPNAVWPIRPRHGTARSLPFEGGYAPGARAE